MTPDVVYVVRPGESNEELRYSLRSLVNLPHGRVWIAGYCPKWLKDVGHIPVSSRIKGRESAKSNLRAACEHPDVSESFVYMCDDFFVMQPMERLPVMHRGTVADMVRNRRMSTSYTRSLEKVQELLVERGIEEPLLYDLHAPMLVEKRRMLEVLDLCSSPLMQELTLYGNLNRLGGERSPNHKVRHRDHGWEDWAFLSTNDTGFASLTVGKFIRSRFPEQGPHEATPPPVEKVRRSYPRRRPVRHTRRLQRVAA